MSGVAAAPRGGSCSVRKLADTVPRAAALIAIVVASFGWSCSAKPKINESVLMSPLKQQLAKLQAYLYCFESHVAAVFQVEKVYADSKRVIRGVSDPKPCLDEIEKSQQLQPPQPELDLDGFAFGKALARVYALLDAHNIDPQQLESAFAEFDRAHTVLFDRVYTINRAAFAEQLENKTAKLGAGNESAAILADRVVLYAQDVVQAGALHSGSLDQIDASAIGPPLAEFERAIDDLGAYLRAYPRKATEEAKTAPGLFERAKTLAAAAHELELRARAHVEFTPSERLRIDAGSGDRVPGTPASLVAAYNRLVNGG